MTSERACALAMAYLEGQGVTHQGLVEVRLLPAERFNRLFGYQKYEEDFWVVEFRKQLDEGVMIESPSTISIMVFTVSAQCCKLSSP